MERNRTRIDHEVRKLAENTTYYVQVFDAIDGVKEFSAKHFHPLGYPCAIYKVEDVKKRGRNSCILWKSVRKVPA